MRFVVDSTSLASPPPLVTEPRVEEPFGGAPPPVTRVPEAAVQDAWVRGLYNARGLRTTEGDPVRVVSPGRLNRDSGPDVTDARLEIGGVLWAGDVEVHRTSAEWAAHGHDRDPAYDRVALHVVLAADRQTGTLRRADGSALPELVLLPHLDGSLQALLRAFYLEPREAPHCAPRWPDVDPAVARAWVRQLGAERLHERARALGRAFGRRPDLDRLLVGRALRALGYAANADAFEELARRLPLPAVRRLLAEDVHAVVFHVSGLDAEAGLFDGDERAATLAGPLGLRPMRPEAWRRGGRPANAPRRRLAQAAALLSPGGALRADAVDGLADALRDGVDVALDRLRTPPVCGLPPLGRARAEAVLVNAVLPVLFLAAEQREDPGLETVALDALDALPAASDRVVRRFAETGFRARTAREAQGLHQLARAYCDEGRCARCAVGLSLYPALGRA
jgi:hypothetical protein